ncbi:MAG: hypothetical protein IIC33_04200, partial [Chloroflexi bacterium]|nr:hypothetical protein [Chloroflexota bacterium]
MSSQTESYHSPYPADMWVLPNARQMTWDIEGKTRAMPSAYKLALAVSGVLEVLGVIGFIVRAVPDGFSEQGPWGYYDAIVGY